MGVAATPYPLRPPLSVILPASSIFSPSSSLSVKPFQNPKPSSLASSSSCSFYLLGARSFISSIRSSATIRPCSARARKDWRVRAEGDDDDAPNPDDYGYEEDEVDEVDNKKDYDVDYDVISSSSAVAIAAAPSSADDIEMVESASFISTQGWDPEMVVDYKINEEEFHKISLLDCDFFIRKPPDPDNDVYDFREMYVTPPDTDIYSIPKVLAPMPQKYIRCAKSEYAYYHVTEPPIDAPRDPLYKTNREIMKVFLTKHYRNRRSSDWEFVLDFEEIYVIDSKTKSITRAKVLVTAPGGGNRDRRDDLLVIRDNGASFKIIHQSQRDDPTTVIEREEWKRTRQDMEKYLRKFRDFEVSNWF
ncbi:PLASTID TRANSCRIPTIONALLY ACTIVE protein 6, chloroplastic [Nymphaea colorata]|nr:PLASTID TRANSCRIPTIONALLY ACTIVE protein 6, chloroplastic [Nymphaea colorata]